jgi:predicted nucleic acid-binding protein
VPVRFLLATNTVSFHIRRSSPGLQRRLRRTEAAGHYARARADLEARGTPIGPLDLMIAAQGLALKATVVTTNLKEFRRVRGLRCEDWTA